MSTAEELTTLIASKGEEIRKLKADKPPTLKQDLEPLIADLLKLKIDYKAVTGEDFGGPKPEEKPKAKEPPKKESGEGEEDKGPSKSQLAKEKKKADAKAKKAEAKAVTGGGTNDSTNNSSALNSQKVDNGEDVSAHLYGDLPIVMSKEMTEKVFRQIGDLTSDFVGQNVWLRGRLHTSRAVGKGCFIVLRQQLSTVQAVMFQGSTISKQMVKYATSITVESIIDILAEVTQPDIPINSVSLKNLELQIKEIHIVTKAQPLPFGVEDASRNEQEAIANQLPLVDPDKMLNFRWIDTRTPANQAIFRIQSGVCQLFREFLISKNFIEIHTPKLIGGASEGGADVFNFTYFNQPACLAQSPQLYKQMAAACGGFDRVFEIGPVFRAEKSFTARHLCEFTGLDFEMTIFEHYYEALDLMGELFAFIFDGIYDRYQQELKTIAVQYPFEPLKYLRAPLRITFQEGIDLLRAAGIEAPYDEDISTPHEKALGAIVKEKYDTDFYIMDKYPLSARPFYTMPDPDNPKLSNSYDLFIRGQEIVSGAQRVHDVDLLIERATSMGIPISSIQSYVDSFKHGALPHAGGGIGLERVVMLYLNLGNIRKTSLFPRDPQRLFP